MSIDIKTPFTLTKEQIDFFRKMGFIKLNNVLNCETLNFYRTEINHLVEILNKEERDLADRDTYGKAFLQIENMFLKNTLIKDFVSSPRIGKIAADLMGTRGVRMYHDQALFKEAGGGHTPWHVDQVYWPFSTDKCITAWIPLVPVTMNMGPLAFSPESHHIKKYRDLIIGDESESKIQQMFDQMDNDYEETAYDLGEISFHYGWTFHRAGANNSSKMREIMTIIYMDIDMVITREDEPWCPGTKSGQIPNNSTNFVIYER